MPGARILLVSCLVSLTASLAAAQTDDPQAARRAWVDAYRWYGVGATVSWPYADFGDAYSTGYGLHALVDRPVAPLLNATADVGWTRFDRDGQGDAIDVWNFTAGARLLLGVLFMGGEAGYLSCVEEWGWVPSLGVRFTAWDLTVSHTTAGADAWTTLRVGYYF